MPLNRAHLLQLLGLFLLIATIGYWFAAGAHTGWSQTQVQVMQYDEITEIEYPVWIQQFVPGIELLSVGIFLSIILASLGFILSTQGRRADSEEPNHKHPPSR